MIRRTLFKRILGLAALAMLPVAAHAATPLVEGTTYKLIRKVHGKQEHVHVVGLRGFGGSSDMPLSA